VLLQWVFSSVTIIPYFFTQIEQQDEATFQTEEESPKKPADEGKLQETNFHGFLFEIVPASKCLHQRLTILAAFKVW